jgi:hypothetical protein
MGGEGSAKRVVLFICFFTFTGAQDEDDGEETDEGWRAGASPFTI